MKWIKRLFVAVVLFVAIGIGGLTFLYYRAQHGTVATSYVPDCAKSDAPCEAWNHFRQAHPYPYQTIATKNLPDGSLIVVLSEPPPLISKVALDKFVKTVFGDDLISSKRLRWMIGTDGWVEDLVLNVKTSKDDPLKDERFLDRIGVLDRALFGTTFGGGFERIDSDSSVAWTNTASNLDVSPREIRTWLSDASIKWHPVDFDAGQNVSWDVIAHDGQAGAFESSDGSLVMLTFPTSLLVNGQKNPAAFKTLEVPFREFAIASQSVFGGVWQENGQTAVLGRVRTQPVNELAPLRFETFVLLASQSEDELSQSYERNAIFAGKLLNGDYFRKDWAPVYLSAPLIDTELGALLNITDQMLKSWSEDGTVEYLYFTYPKPKSFPFHNTALSDVLRKKLKSQSVLFNWNTAGSAVIVQSEPFSILSARQTGALPVTYGANGKPAAEGGENVFNYEEEAYKYFAGLHNPNLARVVQYTVLYQLFRAIAKDVATAKVNQTGVSAKSANSPILARADASALMASETGRLLDDLDAKRLTEPHDLIQKEVLPKLRLFRLLNSGVSNTQLARILSDRFSAESVAYGEAREASLRAEANKLSAEEEALRKDTDSYNRDVGRVNASSSPDDMAITLKMEERSDSIKSRRTVLDSKGTEFKKKSQEDDVGDLREALNELAQSAWDLEAVRVKYVASNQAIPEGSIKTPSVVLSWDRRHELTTTGGHNVNSKAVHFERSTDVSGLTLEERNGETVVRYNPLQADAVESNAGILARAIEHAREDDPEALTKLISDVQPVRTTKDALQISPNPNESVPENPVFATIGKRTYTGKAPFVEDLSGIAERNECCVFVARDAGQTSYIAEKTEIAPPPVVTYEVRDTPSLVEYLTAISKRAGTKSQKAVIFLDEPEEHVQALTLNVSGAGGGDGGSISDMARLIGGEQPSSSRISGIMQPDLRGQRSVLRVWADTLKAQHSKLLERLGIVEPVETWQRATVKSLDSPSVRDVVNVIGWNDATDGVPTAIKVSFETQETPDVSIVAGFESQDAPEGSVHLMDAHRDSISIASQQSGTLAQYMMTIKNQLRALPHARLRRLLLIVEEPGATTTILTRVEIKDERSVGE